MEKRSDLIKLLSHPNVEIIFQATPSSSAETIDFDQHAQEKKMQIPQLSRSHEFEFNSVHPDSDLDPLAGLDSLQQFADLLSFDVDCSNTIKQEESCGLPEAASVFNQDVFVPHLTEEELSSLDAPILSPVSLEDVESILSSMPSSPQLNTVSFDDAVLSELTDVSIAGVSQQSDDSQPQMHSAKEPPQAAAAAGGPTRSIRSSRLKKYSPYQDCYDETEVVKVTSSRSGHHHIPDRKQRKKQQNKDAALRYRQKKKEEQNSIFDVCDALENTNVGLKDKVDGMEREIQYLKDLLLDVYQAKGIQPSQILLNSK